MTTTAAMLRGLAVQALRGATAAGESVYSPLDWASYAGSYPVIGLQTPAEQKESLGRNGAPQFTVTVTLRVTARAQAAAVGLDQGAAAVEAVIEQLQSQIEIALINNPALMGLLQQISSVHVQKDVSAEGKYHLGELVMELGLEFYQGPEDFFPIPAVPLTTVDINADLVNVFDPSGTYLNPPFPTAVNPAPRTSGPDGRDEGSLQIDLPQ